jgi:hypothetical protein
MANSTKAPAAAVMRNWPTWRIGRIAVFSALAVVGSYIKPGGPIPSLAFDSFAGFFVALYFGAAEGALVCGIGHVATAATSGFPFGWLHIPIALGMALAGAAIGLINKLHRKAGFVPALTAGVAINTAMVFPLAPWLGGLLVATTIIAPPLLVVAALNAIVAAIVYVSLRGKLRA